MSEATVKPWGVQVYDAEGNWLGFFYNAKVAQAWIDDNPARANYEISDRKPDRKQVEETLGSRAMDRTPLTSDRRPTTPRATRTARATPTNDIATRVDAGMADALERVRKVRAEQVAAEEAASDIESPGPGPAADPGVPPGGHGTAEGVRP